MFEWFIALRFLREGRAQTLLILTGVAVGVAVIVFLAALIDGLQANLIRQTLGSQAHVVVKPAEEGPVAVPAEGDGTGLVATTAVVEKAPQRVRSIPGWQQVLEDLRRTAHIVAVAPSVTGAAFAVRGGASKAVSLRGVDPALYPAIVDVPTHVVAGRFALGSGEAVIGVDLARDLGLGVGDKLRLLATEGRADVFTLTGLFDLGNKDVNQRWVLVPLRAAQSLLDLPGGVSTIELKVDAIFDADAVADVIAARTGLVAESWMRTNAQLLVALRSQSSSRDLIQFFVIIAVALGIASVLVVSVVQKSREIGILRAVGTSRGQVLRIFLIQGALLGTAGALVGNALGAALSLAFANLVKSPDGAPLFPIELNTRLFLTASAVAIATGLLSALAPARRAARLDPATVIRYG